MTDVLRRMHTYAEPPEGFDPLTAPAKLLRQHGFPRRPDPGHEPRLSQIWNRALRRAPRLRMTRAELAIDPVMSRRRDPRRNPMPDFGPNGWGGLMVLPPIVGFPPPEPVTMAYAEWVVPHVFPVAGDPPTVSETVGFWVGFDGTGDAGYELLQAGTAATITGDSVSYYAWTEWYTEKYQDMAVKVTNFAIQPGDLVSFLVCSPKPDQGFVSMLNYKTQQAMSIGISAPPGITSVGAGADWIVEGITGHLPEFAPIIFNNVAAGTRHFSLDLSTGTTMDIKDGAGNSLTQAVIASPLAGFVVWEGPG